MRYGIAVLAVILFGGSVSAEARKVSDPPPAFLVPGSVQRQPTELPRPEKLTINRKAYPGTSGSTSAEPLGVWVACRLLNSPCAWSSVMGGERRLMPVRPGGENPQATRPLFSDFYKRVRHFGTHGSYLRLIRGEVDLIYECRRPSADEKKEMRTRRISLDIRPVALDAFVFLRHAENPVKGLSLEQVRNIFTAEKDGKAKVGNWKALGGPDLEINAYVRNANSGSQETMLCRVIKDREMIRGRRMLAMTMRGPFNQLERDKAGIGFTFFYYQRYMSPIGTPFSVKLKNSRKTKSDKKPKVEMLHLGGVIPGRWSIWNRFYPLTTEVYVVTRKGLNPHHPAAKLRDWLLTEEGQRIVSETGYLPVGRGDVRSGRSE